MAVRRRRAAGGRAAAARRLVERAARDAPCCTHEIRRAEPVDPTTLPRVEPLPEAAYERLAGRYGHTAHEVLAVAAERGELAQPIVSDLPDLLAEATFAARREQARSLGDVLLRRTRLGLLAAREPGDPEALDRVAPAVAPELGWDAARQTEETARFRDEAAAEGIAP